jgi:hypothetical protein
VSELAIIVPTRGRPDQLRELLGAIAECSTTDVEVWVGLDDDDETDYLAAVAEQPGSDLATAIKGPRRSLSGWTNYLAGIVLERPSPPRYLASLGDDHRPRTYGWDQKLIHALKLWGGTGIAYPNDLLQYGRLPTSWVVSSDIVSLLGWMMLPSCAHLYVDNATLALGQALGRIAYLPDVVVEHVHPIGGKGAWDASYAASNSTARYAADRAAFEEWQRRGLAFDVASIQAGLHVSPPTYPRPDQA